MICCPIRGSRLPTPRAVGTDRRQSQKLLCRDPTSCRRSSYVLTTTDCRPTLFVRLAGDGVRGYRRGSCDAKQELHRLSREGNRSRSFENKREDYFYSIAFRRLRR